MSEVIQKLREVREVAWASLVPAIDHAGGRVRVHRGGGVEPGAVRLSPGLPAACAETRCRSGWW